MDCAATVWVPQRNKLRDYGFCIYYTYCSIFGVTRNKLRSYSVHSRSIGAIWNSLTQKH